MLKTDRQTINKAISISELLRCPILEHCPKGGKGDSKNHKLFNQNICWTFLNREGRGVASKVQIVQSLIFVSFIGQIIIDVTSIKKFISSAGKSPTGAKKSKKNSTFSICPTPIHSTRPIHFHRLVVYHDVIAVPYP